MQNILVTGVGGGVGQSIIKAFENTEYNVIGVDSEPDAAGLYGVKKAYLGLYANDPNFINRIMEIALKEHCKLIFPGHDVELEPFSRNIEEFRKQHIIPVVSDETIINICDDKFETYAFLKSHNFHAPHTQLLNLNKSVQFPIILKPQKGGARSKNTFVIKSEEELKRHIPFIDKNNCVVQEYIEGDEYTCGSVSFNGYCYGVIVMRRTLRAGDTYKAYVVRDLNLENYVREVMTELKPFGACNIQLRMKDGKPYIFEINARCSGTTAARAMSGFNEPLMVADYIIKNKIPSYSIKEISILRYWKELAVGYDKIDLIKKNNFFEAIDNPQL